MLVKILCVFSVPLCLCVKNSPFYYMVVTSIHNYIFPLDPRKSIQEAEEPKRYLVSKADFDVVIYGIAVGNVRNLRKALASASDFKRKSPVYKEISAIGKYGIVVLPDLAAEECLAQRAYVHILHKRTPRFCIF